MKALYVFLAIFMIVAGPGMAYKEVKLSAELNKTLDGVTESQEAYTILKVADPMPTVNVDMFITRLNSTIREPYAGPYPADADVTVYVYCKLQNTTDKLDRLTIRANVYNVTSEQVENRVVLDTLPFAPTGIRGGSQYGIQWQWKAVLPAYDANGNPVV